LQIVSEYLSYCTGNSHSHSGWYSTVLRGCGRHMDR